MPALDHTRIRYRKIDLTEGSEEVVITSQHFHQETTLVWDYLEFLDDNAFYGPHFMPPAAYGQRCGK
jgi:hypothetical protein